MKKSLKKYKDLDQVLAEVQEPWMGYYINYVHTGISYNTFETQSKKVPFTQQDWSKALQLSERTFQRYKKDNKRFEGLYTEKILEIILLFKRGNTIFGSEDLFYTWLNTPSQAMGHIIPITIIDNTFGIQAVNQELGKIEQGVFA